ncbi:MAG: zf-HC2 domain-containing protein [candidate division FCPU426 bacterium]
MNCNQCREHMEAYLKGSLAPENAEPFERHLEGCIGCREELEQVRKLHAALSAWQVPAASPGFETRLAARVREAQARLGRRRAWYAQPAWLGAAAGLVVAVGAAVWWWPWRAEVRPGREAFEVALAQDLDLYENLDLLEDLDLFEHWEEIESVDPSAKEPS